MAKHFYKVIAACLLLLAACVKDKPGSTNTSAGITASTVYVVCEGNFGSGDGSLYQYEPATGTAYGDVYAAANAAHMGDVFQSMARIGDHLFLCINNSDKILVTSANTHKLVAQISIPKPRYILPLGNDRAYVSALYDNKVYIINTATFTVIGSFTIPSLNPEGMCLHLGHVFVTSWDTACSSIYKVDMHTNSVVQSIAVAGRAPQEVLVDKEQMLWVLAGNQPKGKVSSLTRIDPSSGNTLASYIFPADAGPIRPVFNNTKDTLYFIAANFNGGTTWNGIYRMPIHATALPSEPFIPAVQYQYYWALGIAPGTGHIFVGDPKGFTQKGNVTIYRANGSPISSFATGIGPGHFCFQ